MVEIYNFRAIREDVLDKKGLLTMEDEVRVDMLERGLNPTSSKDIKEFWNIISKGKIANEQHT
jgi:hypothetical protein